MVSRLLPVKSSDSRAYLYPPWDRHLFPPTRNLELPRSPRSHLNVVKLDSLRFRYAFSTSLLELMLVARCSR